MCNNCNCDGYDRCSIVGYFPVGFCCSNCYLYDEHHTCLENQLKKQPSEPSRFTPVELKLINASIEGDMLKVTIEQEGNQIPLIINLKKYLESS